MNAQVRRSERGLIALLAALVCLCAALFPAMALADEGAGESVSELTVFSSTISDEKIAESAFPLDSQMFAESSSSMPSQTIVTYSGSNRFETSALQARDGWPEGSESAIIVSGMSWVDALSASGLAGVLDCPILLASSWGLDQCIKDVLRDLGVSKVVIVGGTGVVPQQVVSDLNALGIVNVDRLGGANRYDTQLKVYEYGLGSWGSDLVIVAKAYSEDDFADALSASSLAYRVKAPIFLTDGDGQLTLSQEISLINGAKDGLFRHSVLLGGETCVSARTEGFMWAVSQISSGQSKQTTRIAGKDRWQTSADLASWAISNNYLSAEGATFSSGTVPYDALGGGALAGKTGSVLLLVGNGAVADAVSALQAAGGASTIKFCGGTGAISQASRDAIVDALDMEVISNISYTSYDITLDAFLDILKNNSSYSKEEILSYLDPSNWTYGQGGFYQFAVLSDGYSGKVTAEQINAFLEDWVVYQEANYDRTSVFRNMGQAFIEAAKQYNVNEVYLLAHAVIESAWGCSDLASGTEYDGEKFPYKKEYNSSTGKWEIVYCVYPGEGSDKTYPAGTYYNFCGIGAKDSDPFRGGIKMAISQGWDSPEDGIMGAAKWISDNYINPTVSSAAVSGAQNTLWKMKWDAQRAATEGTVWHQYATSRNWATGIASVMSTFYAESGMAMSETGLKFDVPKFKETN